MTTDTSKTTETRTAHPYRIYESLQRIPTLLQECLEAGVTEQVRQVADRIIQKKIERLFLVGTGSSYFAAVAERFSFDAVARIPTHTYVTSVFQSYPPHNLGADSAVFFHSHSGKTEGDVNASDLARSCGAYTIGVTDIATSPLAQATEDVIIGPGGPKAELPATCTYSTALFRMIQLAAEIGKRTGDHAAAARMEQDLEEIPAKIETFMRQYEDQAKAVVKSLSGCSAFIVVGFGPNLPTADKSAMAFNQSAGIPTQGYELDNFIHGPIQALKPGMCVFIFAPSGPLQPKAFALSEACRVIGAKVVLLTPEDEKNIPSGLDHVIRLPGGVPDLLSPIAFMIPMWQTAYQFGLLGNGGHPDRLSMDQDAFKQAFGYLMKQDKWISR